MYYAKITLIHINTEQSYPKKSICIICVCIWWFSAVWRRSGRQWTGDRSRGTEAGDLGDWCQCGNLQGEVSGVAEVWVTTPIHRWLTNSLSCPWLNYLLLRICIVFSAFPSAFHRPQLQRGWECWSGSEWASLYAETGWGEKCSAH